MKTIAAMAGMEKVKGSKSAGPISPPAAGTTATSEPITAPGKRSSVMRHCNNVSAVLLMDWMVSGVTVETGMPYPGG